MGNEFWIVKIHVANYSDQNIKNIKCTVAK